MDKWSLFIYLFFVHLVLASEGHVGGDAERKASPPGWEESEEAPSLLQPRPDGFDRPLTLSQEAMQEGFWSEQGGSSLGSSWPLIVNTAGHIRALE